DVSLDGQKLLVSIAGALLLVDARTGAAPNHSEGRGGEAVHFSPDGRRAYVVGGDRFSVVDLETMQTIKSMPTGRGHAEAVGASPDGRWVLVANRYLYQSRGTREGRDVWIIEADRLETVAQIRLPEEEPIRIAFSPDSRIAYVSQFAGP